MGRTEQNIPEQNRTDQISEEKRKEDRYMRWKDRQTDRQIDEMERRQIDEMERQTDIQTDR